MEVHRGIAEGLDAVIVNPSLIFGECRLGENTSAILERVRKQKVPGIPVGGTNAVDVLDVVNGHILALEKGVCGERYVLAGNNLLWKDLLGTIADEQDVSLTTRSLNPRYFIPGAYVAEKLSRLVGRTPMITLETARMTARYFKYSSDKAAAELGYSFRPFRDTIARLSN